MQLLCNSYFRLPLIKGCGANLWFSFKYTPQPHFLVIMKQVFILVRVSWQGGIIFNLIRRLYWWQSLADDSRSSIDSSTRCSCRRLSDHDLIVYNLNNSLWVDACLMHSMDLHNTVISAINTGINPAFQYLWRVLPHWGSSNNWAGVSLWFGTV